MTVHSPGPHWDRFIQVFWEPYVACWVGHVAGASPSGSTFAFTLGELEYSLLETLSFLEGRWEEDLDLSNYRLWWEFPELTEELDYSTFEVGGSARQFFSYPFDALRSGITITPKTLEARLREESG